MVPADPHSDAPDPGSLRARAGLWLGPALFALMLLLPAPEGLSAAGWRTAAAGVLMAVWWVSEPLPIAATALLPLALFPVLGVAGIDAAASPYANPIVFLFLGGFLLALAMQRWGLHRRVALAVMAAMGTRPRSLVGGVMTATALLSMWVSNTATALMMLPIGLSVAERMRVRREDDDVDGASVTGDIPAAEAAHAEFAGALMLGIAYAASIGGLGTLIGTPPNALVAAFVRETYGVELGFGRWMLVGVPLVAVLLPLCWLILVRGVYRVGTEELPGGREVIAGERRSLGPVSRAEAAVAVAFALAAAGWIGGPFLSGWLPKGALSDAGVAVAAALALFLVPTGRAAGERVLDWETASRAPWDVLLLFGGGLSLADALTKNGVAGWIGERLGGLEALPAPVLVLLVVAVIVALSEVASNTAVAAAFLPVAGSLALGVGQSPLLLVIPAALAASCGFMLPVATPPNAIAYATGRVRVAEMARAGAWLDLLCIAAVLAAAYTLVPWVFGG